MANSINGSPSPALNAMNAGDGPRSYFQNSSCQGMVVDVAKQIIEEEIASKLDAHRLLSTSPNGTICIADFGCSTGSNSFPVVQIITQAIKQKLLIKSPSPSPQTTAPPEFQVVFNDTIVNDFNTLFASLPTDKPYLAVGVPGDFHGRLLPRSSLHVAYSSWSIHWLTEVPKAVVDRESPAWNPGRVSYANDRKEVCDAYLDQFSRDIGSFLEARAVEMVVGGLMILSVPGVPEFWDPETEYTLQTDTGILGSCLMEMAKEGIVSEAKIDSFNYPAYLSTPRQMEAILRSNESFTVERMDVISNPGKHAFPSAGARAAAVRAAQGTLIRHFGNDSIVDELIERYEKKIEGLLVYKNPDNDKTVVVISVLKRKPIDDS